LAREFNKVLARSGVGVGVAKLVQRWCCIGVCGRRHAPGVVLPDFEGMPRRRKMPLSCLLLGTSGRLVHAAESAGAGLWQAVAVGFVVARLCKMKEDGCILLEFSVNSAAVA
jgi:hypothetical protein